MQIKNNKYKTSKILLKKKLGIFYLYRICNFMQEAVIYKCYNQKKKKKLHRININFISFLSKKYLLPLFYFLKQFCYKNRAKIPKDQRKIPIYCKFNNLVIIIINDIIIIFMQNVGNIGFFHPKFNLYLKFEKKNR